MILNSIAAKSIPNGTKFVALYGDGSGGQLFLICDDGHLYDHDFNALDAAPDTFLMDAGFAYWIELPDSFKLWFEQHDEKRP